MDEVLKKEHLLQVLTEQNKITDEFLSSGDIEKANVSISQAYDLLDEIQCIG